MVETRKPFATLASLLCAHLTRIASILCADGSSFSGHVFRSEVAALVGNAHLLAALLLHARIVYPVSGIARVFEGARTQVELARCVFDALLLLSLSVATGYRSAARNLALSTRVNKLGENGTYWSAPQCYRIKDKETVYDIFL